MIRLFLASVLPSLVALIALPALALTSGGGGDDRAHPREPAAGAAVGAPAIRLMAAQNRRHDREAAKADATVSISDSAFRPAAVAVRVGQTVQWTNADDRDHQVAADKGQFKSGTIKPGDAFEFKFEKAGEYKFHCPLHPRARGVVKVEG